MVITVAPLLLLLVFPVFGSKVPSTEFRSPDIHSVLREMSAKLAEQAVEMRHLLQENKEHSVKLQQLEGQKAELEGQKAELEGQKAELEGQKAEVAKLKRQLKAQAAELTSMKTKSNITENQVEALNRDNTVKRVAFSASLLASGSGATGPFNTHVTLRYRHVVTNIGNAYNPDTGFFIAPVRGVYHFQWYVAAHTTASIASGAVLVKNGIHIFLAYERQHGGYGTSSNGVSLLMEVGDVVFLRLWQGSKLYDNGNHHSTFSGHLLFTM